MAIVAVLAAYAAAYAWRARTLARRGRPVAAWRAACFLAGLVVIGAAVSGPVSRLAGDRLAAHMAEHLLIADLAALLLVLGLTGPLMAPLLRNPILGPLRHLAHPVPALLLWALNLAIWHLPGPHEAAVRHDGVHALQHVLFIGFGVNMWLALLGPLPKPAWFGNLARLGYIVAVRLFGTVLANVFVWADHPLYDVYKGGTTDQVVAGSIMMVEGSILTLGLGCWLFLRAASRSTSAARRAPWPPAAATSCAGGWRRDRRDQRPAARVPSGPWPPSSAASPRSRSPSRARSWQTRRSAPRRTRRRASRSTACAASSWAAARTRLPRERAGLRGELDDAVAEALEVGIVAAALQRA